MLFNSYGFIVVFFPLVAVLFFVFARYVSASVAAAWLAAASVFFYGYWSPYYVLLLLGSIAVNYALSRVIQKALACNNPRRARTLLIVGIVANLLILGYYKYFNFFIESLVQIGVPIVSMVEIVLPIGISFFSFTQIAYLVDTYQHKVRESRFVPYLLFVTYFPHLVAGPILHHAEMMPQFARALTYRFDLHNVTLGLTTFVAGLFKKVVLADGIQPFVGPVFDATPLMPLSALEAWGGALAYALQLYFDFSGYSDMAIGLSKVFNVDLPLNFNSPYKAANIVEFWRRWHMTLSRFLRDYLYIPLGGNRHGAARRYLNLAVTMLLGGLWHGAAWTFVIWGALHGVYLVINHMWQALANRVGLCTSRPCPWRRSVACAITFIAVVYAWIFFRATSLDKAWDLVTAMSGVNGWLPATAAHLWVAGGVTPSFVDAFATRCFSGTHQVLWISVLLAIAWCLPNTQTLGSRLSARLVTAQGLSVDRCGLLLGALLVSVTLLAMLNGGRGQSEFIYFNF